MRRGASAAVVGGLLLLAAACRDTASEPADPAVVPAAPRGGAVSSDGARISYSYDGYGSPALLFIHGWACDRGYWSEQVDAFLPERLVVTLDLAGHGSSDARRGQPSFTAFAEDVRAVVETIGIERVILVGHSLGAYVALEAARLMPERVVAVIGVDALHNAETTFDRASWEQRFAELERDFPAGCDRFVRGMFAEGGRPDLVRRVTADICSTEPAPAVAVLRLLPEYDLGAALREVQVPIRCINSAVWPTAVAVNRRYAADFDAVILKDVGHFPMLERPQEFNVALAQVLVALLREPAR